MIYALSRDLAADLARREFPVSVFYGPHMLSPAMVGAHSRRIVVERDRGAGDTVAPTVGARGSDPRSARIRWLGCTATIYAQAPVAGAMVSDHEALCDQLVDAVIASLCGWATEARSMVEFGAGRYLLDSEVAEAHRMAGVVYRLEFKIARGVTLRKYDGTTRPTVAAPDVRTNVRVSRNGVDYETVPTGQEG